MSDYLFSRPSFLSGMARVGDLHAQYDAYNESPTPREADENATLSDWAALGNDMREAAAQEFPTPRER